MSTPQEPATPVNEADAAAIAHHAGLTMSAERLARFAADLSAARQLVADLKTVSTEGRDPVPGPFDAAWPVESVR